MFRTPANTPFRGLMLALAVCCVTTPAIAATRIWLGANSLWSNPDNWSPFGVPQNGDSLTFPAANPFIGFSMNNDLVNLSIDTTGAGYTLNGNLLTLNQGITDNHTAGAINRVRCDIQFASRGGRFNTLSSGPPPRLAIGREAAPQNVRIHWSTAYPGWIAQSARKVTGTYTKVPLVPIMVNGRFALTNLPATSNGFFRLREP